MKSANPDVNRLITAVIVILLILVCVMFYAEMPENPDPTPVLASATPTMVLTKEPTPVTPSATPTVAPTIPPTSTPTAEPDTPTPTAEPTTVEPVCVHTVKPGDTVSGIVQNCAGRPQVSDLRQLWAEVCAYNKIQRCNRIYPQSVIKIIP